MTDKIIITAALAGGATTKAQNEAVPYTPEEFGREAKRVEEAGGAIVHIHFREPITGKNTVDSTIMKETMDAIRQNSKLLVNLSTGVDLDFTAEQRKQPIVQHTPELASLNPGSMNFCMVNYKTGEIIMDKTYVNPFWATIDYGKLMKDKGIKPELECFAISHVHNCLFFAEHYDFLVPPLHFSIVFGVMGGIRFNSDTLNSFIHAIPAGSTWQGIGIGPICFKVAMATAALGGHIRVGLEDNIYIDPTTRTKSRGSWDQVEKAVQIAKLAGREPASPEEARKILSLPGKK
jgi:3-keto-5-aminohexanoate cleavage enzyme